MNEHANKVLAGEHALVELDPVWNGIRSDAALAAAGEPLLAGFLHAAILSHRRLEGALSYILASKLGSANLPALLLRQVFDEVLAADPAVGQAVRADLAAVFERDPACARHLEPLLYYKGFHALESHRMAHWLLRQGRRDLALHLQSRISEQFGVDIHPAARIGRGVFIDHGTGVVIGETAVVEDDVSMLHGVTLGGTGKESGDRHPKIRRGALLSAGAKVLGNIEIGEQARVAASSVVLRPVKARTTVAGIPARAVGSAARGAPARDMDHRFGVEALDYAI